MEILFVRHGETEGNVAGRHQEETTKLTDLGVKQAYEAAEIIKEFKPTHLISSSLVRAIQTSRIISEACGLTTETSHKFIELVRPDHMYGHYHHSFKSISYYLKWYFGGIGGDGEGPGESYKALIARIKQAQQYLAGYPEDARIVVVSHAVFSTFFVAHLCNEKPVDPFRGLVFFHKMLTMPNAHIIPVKFDSQCTDGSCPWSVNS